MHGKCASESSQYSPIANPGHRVRSAFCHRHVHSLSPNTCTCRGSRIHDAKSLAHMADSWNRVHFSFGGIHYSAGSRLTKYNALAAKQEDCASCWRLLAVQGLGLAVLSWLNRVSSHLVGGRVKQNNPAQEKTALNAALVGLVLGVAGGLILTLCYLGSLATVHRGFFSGLLDTLGMVPESIVVGLASGIFAFLDGYLLRKILGALPSSPSRTRRWAVYIANGLVGFVVAFLTLFLLGGLKDSIFELYYSREVAWGFTVPALLFGLYSTFIAFMILRSINSRDLSLGQKVES